MSLRRALIATACMSAACCTSPAPEPTPPPVSTPAPAPALTPTPAPPPAVAQPVYDNWMDAPATPGDWEYRQFDTLSQALFAPDTDYGTLFQCQYSTGQVLLGVTIDGPGQRVVRIRTETSERITQTRPEGGTGPRVVLVEFSGTDPILDAIAFSRGRFAVEVEGARNLYLPAWPEITRVVEDCR